MSKQFSSLISKSLFIIIYPCLAIAADIKILSNQLLIDRSTNIATYNGNVKVEFDDYHILTDEIIMTFNQENNDKRNDLKNIVFPKKITLYNNDLSIVMLAPLGEYDNNLGIMKSKGVSYIMKDKQIITTKNLEIFVGKLVGISK